MAIEITTIGTIEMTRGTYRQAPVTFEDELQIRRRDIFDIISNLNGAIQLKLSGEDFISPRKVYRDYNIAQVKNVWWNLKLAPNPQIEYTPIAFWWAWDMIKDAYGVLQLSPLNGLNIDQVITDLTSKRNPPPRTSGLKVAKDIVQVLNQTPLAAEHFR